MNRRQLILGAGSLLTAPALVRASSLDYVPRAARALFYDFDTKTIDMGADSYTIIFDAHGIAHIAQHGFY